MSTRSAPQFAQIVTFTPQQAKAILERAAGHNFRSLRKVYALQLAKHMREGRWQLNGEAIKFDDNDVLTDGQHRLQACVTSGVPLTTWVVRGVPRDAEMDAGRTRSIGDRLTARGEVNSRNLGAALNALMVIEHGKKYDHSKASSLHLEIEKYLKAHPRLRSYVNAEHSKFRLFDRSTTFPALAYCFDSSDELSGHIFMQQLAHGTDMQEGSPVLVLRNMLLKMRASKRKLDLVDQLAVCIKAFNFHLEGRTVRYIAWRTSGAHVEEFPKIIGCTVFGDEYLVAQDR